MRNFNVEDLTKIYTIHILIQKKEGISVHFWYINLILKYFCELSSSASGPANSMTRGRFIYSK